ncbi:glycosyltransferase [Paracoccus sp. CPCC 101403]|uniref:Glycosyltransferase n=1 Tax=Paracoccus broussonetiae TaxID=3075834 RepID=A0ABU3EGJ7_9RHOB|nr:glycosyltransferase [Paracoccus sp. CPCC 101403]MDT1062947.1 glycosyltransferase [Paracoccus sp. CPCC 101403]
MIADAFRRWKQGRRIARAEAEIATRAVVPRSHGLDAPLVVSLTSYAARFASLPLVLRSLTRQTVRPDRVILWLDKCDEQALPSEARGLGVEVLTCPDMRSYKKIVPTLAEAPGAYVVTADDDVYYGPDWLEGLARHAGQGVVCHRAHRVSLAPDGQPRSYGDWQRNISAPDRSALIFPTGVGGVLYAPGVFHPDVARVDLFQELAPSADDVWLYWMHRLAGSQPAKVGGRFRITEWPGSQAQNLRGQNLVGDGNDRAVRAMIGRYGFPG